MAESGVRVVSQFEVPEGRYQVRVASSSGDARGSVVYDVEVPDFTDGPLALSGVALAVAGPPETAVLRPGAIRRATRKAPQCRSGSCAATSTLEGTLVAWTTDVRGEAHWLHGALPAPPITRRDSASHETLALFAEVYDNNSRVRRDSPYTIELAVRLHDARGEIVRSLSERRQ